MLLKKINFGEIFTENETGYPLIMSNVKINNLKTILFESKKMFWIQYDFWN